MAFLQQLKKFWQSLPSMKRLALVLVTASVLLAVLAIAAIGSHVTYAFLYSNLEPRDAAAIVQKLDELKIPYVLEAGGSAVKVPKEKLHEVRLQLASDGLPSGGGVGNEIFDSGGIGSTEFENEVKLRRALEGELARSISALKGVRQARVHLVLPKRRLFAAKTEGASASVVITADGAQSLGRREVAGIVHLVATAVPMLTHDRVTVVSADGTTLHRPDEAGAGAGGLGDAQGDRRRESEQQLESRVRSMLERMTGAGAVEVRVNMDLDHSARERTEEHYSPTNTAIRSEHKTEELTGVEEATVAGVPGAAANLPDTEPAVATTEQGGRGNVVRRSHTRNWEVDRVVEKTQLPAGKVERLSVAVLIDGKYEIKEGEEIYTPRPQAELDELRSIVASAVGLREDRGDSLEIKSMRFSRPALPEPEAPEPFEKVRRYVPYATAAAGALAVLMLLGIVWRTRRRRTEKEQEVFARQAEREEELRLAAAEARLLTEARQGSEIELDPALALQRRTEAIEIATGDPATAAIVLREWLKSPASSGQLLQGAQSGGR